jgi:hypothetical protein
MKQQPPDSVSEGLQVTRLIMVLSSMAPLFVLWAVRGSPSVADKYFIPACLLLAIAPTAVLWIRIRIAKKNNDHQIKTIAKADDHRDRILVYLFAMLLPFYTVNLKDPREFAATVMALVFIVFLFWHLNMHYMNLLFAVRGYRVFTVTPNASDPVGSKTSFVVLTRRSALLDGQKIAVFRLSDTVFIEE